MTAPITDPARLLPRFSFEGRGPFREEERDLEPQERKDEYPHYIARFSDEYMLKSAEEKGCDVEYSDDYTLMLDLDGDEAYQAFWRQYDILQRHLFLFVPESAQVRYSRSGLNRHVTLKLYRNTPLSIRILLQALLGSDIKREALAYVGMLKGHENPVVLFRPRTQGEAR